MKKAYTFFAAALVIGSCAAFLTACGGDDKDDPNGPVNPDAPVVDNEMTPTESKKYLEETATEFMSKFRPAEQQELIELSSYFDQYYGDLDWPENFDFESTGTPKAMMNALGEVGRCNVSAFASAAITYSYDINFDKIKGVYQPKDGEWVKVSESQDLVFRFTNSKGGDAQLTVKASGEVSNIDFTTTDWDYTYDDVTGNYNEYDIENKYNLALPHEVTYTLISDGKTLANGKVVSSVDFKNHKFALQAETNVMNVTALVEATGNDNKIEQNSYLTVSGVKLASTSAAVNGNHMCDRDHWEAYEDTKDEAAYLAGIFTSGSASADILGRVKLEAAVKDFNKKLVEACGNNYDSYDYNNRDAAIRACQSDCDIINNALNTSFRYNSNTVQGSIFMQPYLSYESSWGDYNYWEYEIETVLKFASDNTTYSFDEYFEKGFGNVTDQWESLIDNYKRIWKNVK